MQISIGHGLASTLRAANRDVAIDVRKCIQTFTNISLIAYEKYDNGQ